MSKKKTKEIKPSKERLLYLRRARNEKAAVYSVRIFILVAIFGLWELAGNLGWIDPFIMSQPSRILNTIANLYAKGDLFRISAYPV